MSNSVIKRPNDWLPNKVPSLRWISIADSLANNPNPDLVLPDMWSRMLQGTFCDEGGTGCNAEKKDGGKVTTPASGLHALQEEYWLSLPVSAQPVYGSGNKAPRQLAFGTDPGTGENTWNIGYGAPVLSDGKSLPLEIPAYIPYFITKRIENPKSGSPTDSQKMGSRLQDFMQLVMPAGLGEDSNPLKSRNPLVVNPCFAGASGKVDDISWWEQCWTVFDKYGNIFNVDSHSGLPFDPKRNPAQFLWIENEVTRPFRMSDDGGSCPYYVSEAGTNFPVFANNANEAQSQSGTTAWMHGYGEAGTSSFIQNLQAVMNAQNPKDTIKTEYAKLSDATRAIVSYAGKGEAYWKACQQQLTYLDGIPDKIIGYPCVTGLAVTGNAQKPLPTIGASWSQISPSVRLCESVAQNGGGGKEIGSKADCTGTFTVTTIQSQADIDYWWDHAAKRTGGNSDFLNNSLNSRGRQFTSAISRFPVPDFPRESQWGSFELNPTLSTEFGWILYKSYPKLWMTNAQTGVMASPSKDRPNNPYWTGKATTKNNTSLDGTVTSRLDGLVTKLVSNNVASCINNLFASENEWYVDTGSKTVPSKLREKTKDATMWMGQNATDPVYFILYNPVHRSNLDNSTAPSQLAGGKGCPASGAYGCESLNTGITGNNADNIADYPQWSTAENAKGYPCPGLSLLRQQLLNNYYQSIVPLRSGPYWDNGMVVDLYEKPPTAGKGNTCTGAGGYNPDPSALCCMTVAPPWDSSMGSLFGATNHLPSSFGNGWFSYVNSSVPIITATGTISITVMNQYQYGCYICAQGSVLYDLITGLTKRSGESSGTGKKGNIYNTYMCSAPNCFQNANGGVWSPCGRDPKAMATCDKAITTGGACGTRKLDGKTCSSFPDKESCIGESTDEGVYPCTWNVKKGTCDPCEIKGTVYGIMGQIYPSTSMIYRMMYTSQWTGVGEHPDDASTNVCTSDSQANINICSVSLSSAGGLSWTGSANCGGGTQSSNGDSSTGSLPCTTIADKGMQASFDCDPTVDCHGWACINGKKDQNYNPSYEAAGCAQTLGQTCIDTSLEGQSGVQVVYPGKGEKNKGTCKPCGGAGQDKCADAGGYSSVEDCFEATGFPSEGHKLIYECKADAAVGAKCVSVSVADNAKLSKLSQFDTMNQCLASSCYKSQHHGGKSGGGGGTSGGDSKKKSKSNTKLIIIVVCSVVGAILLTVGGYFLFRPQHPKAPSVKPAK